MNTVLTCSFCTFINEKGTICEACGRTLNKPSIDFKKKGIICSYCTYDNPLTTTSCLMCAGLLTTQNNMEDMECKICLNQFTLDNNVEMPFCGHQICVDCAKSYFTMKINTKAIMRLRCPMDVCEEFDKLSNKMAFVTKLDTVLKSILSKSTYDIYKDSLSIVNGKDGGFKCSYCERGFVKSTSRRINKCSVCNKAFCAICNVPWTQTHSSFNCVAAENVSDGTNTSCPKCKFKFYLDKGGCLHITCTQCGHEYCEFCSVKMTGRGKSCDFQNCNKQNSLHGHHPRGCMYYIREMDHTKLERLLKRKAVSFFRSCSHTKCQTEVAIEHGINLIYKSCNQPVTSNNMCLEHYKWYLAELLRVNAIDPVDVMDNLECYCELKRNNIPIPSMYSKRNLAVEDDYTNDLRKFVRTQIPYKKP